MVWDKGTLEIYPLGKNFQEHLFLEQMLMAPFGNSWRWNPECIFRILRFNIAKVEV